MRPPPLVALPTCARPTRKAGDVCGGQIRINVEGMLSMQYMVCPEDLDTIYVEFVCLAEDE